MSVAKRLVCVVILVVLANTDTSACTCTNTSGDVLFQRADAVFAGRVIGVEGDKVTFEVEKSWKYIRLRRVEVYETGKGSCRWSYRVGDRMIIHASLKGGALSTNMCMGFGSPDRPDPRFANLESRGHLSIDEEASANPNEEARAGTKSDGGLRPGYVIITAGVVLLVLLGIWLLRRGGRQAA